MIQILLAGNGFQSETLPLQSKSSEIRQLLICFLVSIDVRVLCVYMCILLSVIPLVEFREEACSGGCDRRAEKSAATKREGSEK